MAIRASYRRPPVQFDRLADDIERYADLGVTDLFLETFWGGETIHPSAVVTQKDAYPEDYLERAIEVAHEHDVRLHAWLHLFFWFHVDEDGDVGSDHILGGDDEVTLDGETYHVDSDLLARDAEGGVLCENGKVFASPFHEGVRETVLDVVEETADTAVDGVSLDYVRFPKGEPGYGYGPAAPDLTGDPLHERRVDVVHDVVEAADERVGDVIHSASVFPTYYHDPGPAEYNKSQDWRAWLETTDLDWMLPMCYAPKIDGLVEQIRVCARAQAEFPDVDVLPIVALMGGHPSLDEQAAILDDYGFADYAIWKAEFLDESHRETLAR